jgi:pimeloyl-ACP methyl ester carboxylesterase
MKHRWRYILVGVFSMLVIALAGFLVWASSPPKPEQQALDDLESSQSVRVIGDNRWIAFLPIDYSATTGLILYPGGRVDYRAYTPHAQGIAEEGFVVVIVRMPLNFAFLGVERADEVMDAFPEIKSWSIGGHSLGGAMAAQYAAAHPKLVDGLVLWASYPAESNDLSKSNLAVISIFASNDGVATIDDIEVSRDNLPYDSQYIEIIGGNHAGFGWYGPQNGDGEAQITKQEQQNQIVNATVNFLMGIGD